MSSKDKLIARFLLLPSDFTFDELERLLKALGYTKSNKGKTSGSRVIFKDKEGHPIMLHKPHPGNIVKQYALRQVLEELENKGYLK
ncbi:MAG: type II toxin-antitoxin system HicA family toxin [Paludibacteraceae bacterium]|nr:type II toxin-antitoxin system HicA family toxin [Paludibacteraceae bacterium]